MTFLLSCDLHLDASTSIYDLDIVTMNLDTRHEVYRSTLSDVRGRIDQTDTQTDAILPLCIGEIIIIILVVTWLSWLVVSRLND